MLKLIFSRYPSILNVWVALWITALANVTFFRDISALTPYSGPAAWLFLSTTGFLLWAYISLFLQLTTWSLLARPFLTLVLLASALTAFFVDNFGVGIDSGQIQNMMETDVKEVRDLISLRLFVYVLVIAGLPIIALWWQPLRPQRWTQTLKFRTIAIVLSTLVMAGAAFAYYVDYASIFREHRALRLTIVPHNSIGGLLSYYKKHGGQSNLPLQAYGTDAKRLPSASGQVHTKPTLMILVVGETARAKSFGLNGYSRDTTPELAKRGVTNYPQVSSCGTATAVSLPCMFSGFTRSDYDAKVAAHREGLLDIVQRAGYQVTWIDNNSGCKGACARVENVPLSTANHATWCQDGECQDDLLVNTLVEYLSKAAVKDRLIVLHQAGSHGPAYYRRYPKAFQRYTPTCNTNALQSCAQQAVINSYDNTIVYTDAILARVIDTLRAQSGHYKTAFWYVSDHGESTGEKGLYLHGAPYLFAPSEQTHVPMVSWISPELARQLPAMGQCPERVKGTVLSHDNLFHTVLGLLGIQTSVYDKQLDIVAQCL